MFRNIPNGGNLALQFAELLRPGLNIFPGLKAANFPFGSLPYR